MNGSIPRPIKERKKHDRFNGMPEEEVSKRTLPDHLTTNLDIIIVSTAAYINLLGFPDPFFALDWNKSRSVRGVQGAPLRRAGQPLLEVSVPVGADGPADVGRRGLQAAAGRHRLHEHGAEGHQGQRRPDAQGNQGG